MALYRSIQMTFWTDSKIIDDFTPEERYFYLYLLTNPHTNLAGCYEISFKQMADETGYNRDKIEKLIKRLAEVHKVISYSMETKEVLMVNWSRYNWTGSEKFQKSLQKDISMVKNPDFKGFLQGTIEGIDTVSIPYTYPIDTTNTNTNTNTNTKKHKYGEYQHVLLSDDDLAELKEKHSEQEIEEAIRYFDEYIEEKKYKSQNHRLTMERWVFKAINERRSRDKPTPKEVPKGHFANERIYDFEEIERKYVKGAK